MNKYFRCLCCAYVDECPQKPDACWRCKFIALAEVTDHIGILLDSGEVKYCEACQKVHSR